MLIRGYGASQISRTRLISEMPQDVFGCASLVWVWIVFQVLFAHPCGGTLPFLYELWEVVLNESNLHRRIGSTPPPFVLNKMKRVQLSLANQEVHKCHLSKQKRSLSPCRLMSGQLPEASTGDVSHTCGRMQG